MRRKDQPPKGVGKPDLLSVPGMEALDKLTPAVLRVSKEDIEQAESDSNSDEEPQTA
jgi:hypothetical protein